jgi:integrase
MAIRKRVGKKGVSWQIDYLDPTGKRVRESFKKRKEAEAELGKRISLMAEKRYLDVKKEYRSTFGELVDRYTENFQHQKSFSTKSCYFGRLKEYFGEATRLSNITYLDCETYANKLRTRLTRIGSSIRKPASINREVGLLHTMFNKAVEWDMMEQNPFAKGKSLHLKENNRRTRFLNEEEIERLLIKCECAPYLHRLVETAINTGMRKEELLSLKWSQIRNGLIYLVETKTDSPREIPVNGTMKKIFKEIRKEDGLSSEYVFTKHGKRIRYIGPAFKGALRRAGITDFHFNDLRHTFASHLVMKGASLKEVQELLGHTTVTMTLRYAHLSQENKVNAVGLLDSLGTLSQNRYVPKASQK